MNKQELARILWDLLDEIEEGSRPNQDLINEYSDYIVSKIKDRIGNLMMDD